MINILQVFPLKAELLKPQEQMERHITDLVKKVKANILKFQALLSFSFCPSLFGQLILFGFQGYN